MLQEHLVRVGSLFKTFRIENDPVLLKAKQLKTSDQSLIAVRFVYVICSPRPSLESACEMEALLDTCTSDFNEPCVCLCHGRCLL